MNSPFALIFKSIMARIESEVPDIKYIDLDLGQLEGNSIRPAVAFPCALVKFQNWTFTNLGTNSQVGEGDVIIKIGFAQFSKSDSLTDPLWRDFALEYFELEWLINMALHGWSPETFAGILTRATADSQNLPKGIMANPIRYRLEIEDHSTKPVITTITPPPPAISS